MSRIVYHESQQPRKTPATPTGTTGAISELAVCSYFLSRGYYVYRTQSQNSPCDLVIMNSSGETARVEVTTSSATKLDGTLSYGRKSDRYKFDILCVVNGLNVHMFSRDNIPITDDDVAMLMS